MKWVVGVVRRGEGMGREGVVRGSIERALFNVC